MGRKLKHALFLAMAVILTVMAVVPAGAISIGNGSLKVEYLDEGTPIPGAVFRAYRVTGGGYTPEGDFADCGVTLNEQMGNSEWRQAAQDVSDYAKQNGIPPVRDGVTDGNGVLVFEGLEPGLYLVDGDAIQIGNSTYTPQPFWVEVVDGETAYAEPKFDKHTEPEPGTEPEKGSLTVTKQVAGSGASAEEEFSFRVSLSETYAVEGGTMDAGTLSGQFGDMLFQNGVAEFTLRHGESVTASGLPAGIQFLVEESDPKGYAVMYEGAEGVIPSNTTAFAVVTNTLEATPTPEEPTPTPDQEVTPTPEEPTPEEPTPTPEETTPTPEEPTPTPEEPTPTPEEPTPTPEEPTPIPEESITPEPTQPPTETPEATPSQAPEQVPSQTPEQEPSQTPEQQPTETPEQEPSQTPGGSQTVSPTATPGQNSGGGWGGSSGGGSASNHGDGQKGGPVKTGDENMPGLWIALLMVSGAAAFAVVKRNVKR